jgi:hypothetical protein
MPETLSKYIARLEEVEPQLKEQKGIVFSDEVKIEDVDEGNPGIRKTPIAWPLYRHNMYYMVEVKPGTDVPRHSHEEDVFRLVTKGSLKINGINVEAGTWFVVRAHTEYEISTHEGYTCFSGYLFICLPWMHHQGHGAKETAGSRGF